jgi:hypothetical protein
MRKTGHARHFAIAISDYGAAMLDEAVDEFVYRH